MRLWILTCLSQKNSARGWHRIGHPPYALNTDPKPIVPGHGLPGCTGSPHSFLTCIWEKLKEALSLLPFGFASTALPGPLPPGPGSTVFGAQWCLAVPLGSDITILAFSGFHFLFLSARLLKCILQPLVALFSKLP